MKNRTDFIVGLFIIAGIFCLVYMSISFGEVDWFKDDKYRVSATFTNVTGLKVNTAVEMLGIKIGNVESIQLKDYMAKCVFLINRTIELPEDSVASIRTRGLLGEKYVSLEPGGLPTVLTKDGNGELVETRPPVIMEEMIGKMMFGSAEDGSKK